MTAPLVHASYVEIIRDTPLRDAPTIPAGTVGYVLEEIETYPVRYRVRWPGLDAPSVHAPDDLRPSTESEWQAGIAAKGTTPHTPAALDVAAIEARAAAATPGAPDDRAWGPHVARWRDSGSLNPYADDLAHAVVEQEQTLALICEDNAMLLAALRTLTAQHAADVAAAVDAASRSTRGACAAQLRARAECLRRYAYEATVTADAEEYAHDAREADTCAAIVASVALAAPEAAVDVVALVPRVEGAEANAAYLTHAANTAPDLARQVLALAAALRTERAAREAAEAQHAALAGAVRAYLAAVDAHRAEKTRWQREYIPAEGVQRARIAEALAVVGTKRTALDAALATTTTTPKESR